MKTDYQGKVVFDEPQSESSAADVELTAQQQFSEQESFLPEVDSIDDEKDIEQQLEQSLNQRSKRRWAKPLLLALVGLTGWQTVEHVLTAYQSGDWLALGWSGLIASVAALGITAIGREFLTLRRLKQRQSEREQAQALLDADGIGQGRTFCTKLAKQSGIASEHTGYEQWQQSLAATHNDKEVLELYDNLVLTYQDKQARKLVAKYSGEAALMVALSPLAVADMLLVAWRNFRLIEQIARVYGVELGYWSRIRLIKLVLANMAMAGASELVIDTSVDLMSMDIAGRVSTRVAQGLGVGLLTGRLGLKAMNLMRPIPWHDDKQPRLSEIRSDLLKKLTKGKAE